MPIQLLIDTDPAMGTKDSDPEDSFAITFALSSPELEVVGITCVAGNVPVANGYANARHLLRLLGREDIPVASGPDLPLEPGRRPSQVAWLADGAARDVIVDPSDVPLPKPDAVELIAQCARDAGGGLVIAPIGPLTNIALALRRHPWLMDEIAELRVMGGAFDVGGNHTPFAEFNFWADPEAADEVVRSGIPITYVGLDVCNRTRLTNAQLNPSTISSELGAFVIESCAQWFGAVQSADDRGIHLFDTLTIASLVDPSLLSTVPGWVSIETGTGPAQGASGAWMEHLNSWWSKPESGEPGRIALDLDLPRFEELFAERVLARL
jgi:inosine-uridine nucleoside N-ribohydrolase